MIGHVVDRCLDELMFEVMLILEGSSLSLQIAFLYTHFCVVFRLLSFCPGTHKVILYMNT